MDFIESLIAKARSALTPIEKPKGERHAVESNSFDREDWAEVQRESSVVRDQVKELSQKVSYAPDLMQDLHAGLYKHMPRVRHNEEMAETHQVNREVMHQVLQTPEIKTLRQHTVGDKVSAAMGIAAVQPKVIEVMQHVREAQAEHQRAEEEAKAQQEKAAQELAEWLAAAEQAQQNPNAPFDQEGIGKGMQDAMDQFNQAQQQVEQAQQQAQDAAAKAAKAGVQQVRSAAKQATAELDEQEAMMSAFGVDPGEVQRMSVKERLELAAKLKDNRLAKFIKLLGQFKMVQQAESRKRVKDAASEVHGVRYSNDLPRMVTSEYLNFAHPALEMMMMARWASGQLLTTDVRGKEKLGQGPIVCIVDESGSMMATDVAGGSREAWSKALALAMLDQARHRKRDFVYIGFSSRGQQHMVEFPKAASDLTKIIKMTEHFFGGGTEYEAPLTMALDYIEKAYDLSELQRPDIVFISDDEYGEMPKPWLKRYKALKEKIGIRTYGIALGCSSRGAMAQIADSVNEVTELVSDPRTMGHLFRNI